MSSLVCSHPLIFHCVILTQIKGKYPIYVTVIGYEIKRRRFEELHIKALRWPKERLEYIGIDANKHEMESAKQGEVYFLPSLNERFSLTRISLADKRVPPV
jgi:hypothetical protein